SHAVEPLSASRGAVQTPLAYPGTTELDSLTAVGRHTQKKGHDPKIMALVCLVTSLYCYRSSVSRPSDAAIAGVTATRNPVRTHARWLGAKRGASKPSLISRVTAKRLNEVAGRYS